MSKSKKSLLIFLVILFIALCVLCVCSKLEGIYSQLYPQSSNVVITKDNSKTVISGIFSTNELMDQTVDKFKMFNNGVTVDNISVNENITDDKWYDVMENIAYYFSNNLEHAKLTFNENHLTISGLLLSKKAKDDIVSILESLKANGVYVTRKFDLIEAKTTKQKVKKDLYELLHSKTIEFEKQKATIKSETYALLDMIASKLQKFSDVNIVIQGHTDNTGTDEFNNKLSIDRAEAIKEYFVQKGVDENRLSTVGYGKTRPAFPNNSDKNRQKNRRVEFKIKGE